MLKRLCVENFHSFLEGMEVDFSFDGKVPEAVKVGRDYSTILGIKGANGSGKTNIIKALAFLNNFCSTSFDWDKDEPIPLESHFNNPRPTCFYVEFIINDIQYTYELTATSTEVLSEALHKKELGKKIIKVLEREKEKVVYTSDELKELNKIKLKLNSSVLCVGRSYNFDSDMDDLLNAFLFFAMIISNVHQHGYYEISNNLQKVSKNYFENEDYLNFASRIIKSADDSIQSIEIVEYEGDEGQTKYLPFFIHTKGDEEFKLNIYQESSGTQSLFYRLHLYFLVLESGGILALDEFDIHLHAMILPRILKLFIDKESNKTNAQFIFTAHNTEIIDELGKYRTILVNKEDNESYCYRLDEIPGSIIRNGRPISPIYLQGKIGGIPSE